MLLVGQVGQDVKLFGVLSKNQNLYKRITRIGQHPVHPALRRKEGVDLLESKPAVEAITATLDFRVAAFSQSLSEGLFGSISHPVSPTPRLPAEEEVALRRSESGV